MYTKRERVIENKIIRIDNFIGIQSLKCLKRVFEWEYG